MAAARDPLGCVSYQTGRACPHSECRDLRLASAALQPAPTVERTAVKPQKAVTSTKPVGNDVGNARRRDLTVAARQAKWRAKHPEQHRDQMRTLRAKRKAGNINAAEAQA